MGGFGTDLLRWLSDVSNQRPKPEARAGWACTQLLWFWFSYGTPPAPLELFSTTARTDKGKTTDAVTDSERHALVFLEFYLR
ncbi:hypothetical protein EGI31_22090 [Lacihabitans soyangensis]|uniref:Uncharacterized protein n=1 Tax=Lacihabitans soyangensis TaxID=869394 RepID=A0AAE3KX78_9BACT|nr:hypothetical protein [Lacihabitans soyangensis]MCP9764295.1 hypothetical protein [Lacihabitans soyangensis]MCP9764298.1 hypothetical protein [Lacihabitans soyangensis]MCP9765635.1 hypothetical protein [Lacihabitans soyangensis]